MPDDLVAAWQAACKAYAFDAGGHDPQMIFEAGWDTASTQLTAERDALAAKCEALAGALEPFAFLEMEKNEGPADAQYVWECIYNNRVQDWFSFDEIDLARAALAAYKGDAG